MKTIAELVDERRNGSIYVEAAILFKTSYKYVWYIAHGKRKATRGKGREIREWMEKRLQNNSR